MKFPKNFLLYFGPFPDEIMNSIVKEMLHVVVVSTDVSIDFRKNFEKYIDNISPSNCHKIYNNKKFYETLDRSGQLKII